MLLISRRYWSVNVFSAISMFLVQHFFQCSYDIRKQHLIARTIIFDFVFGLIGQFGH